MINYPNTAETGDSYDAEMEALRKFDNEKELNKIPVCPLCGARCSVCHSLKSGPYGKVKCCLKMTELRQKE